MKKRHKIILRLMTLILFISVFCLFWSKNYAPSIEIYSTMLTVIAIIFGFNISSLAMLHSSKYAKEMAKVESETGYTNNLQFLLGYYRVSNNLCLFLFIMLMVQLVSGDINTSSNDVSLILYYLSLAIDGLSISLFFDLILVQWLLLIPLDNSIQMEADK